MIAQKNIARAARVLARQPENPHQHFSLSLRSVHGVQSARHDNAPGDNVEVPVMRSWNSVSRSRPTPWASSWPASPRPAPADGFDRLHDWLARGFAGEMDYMRSP